MCLLILASIVIITIISITPIIILSLGYIKNGQRDLILSPQLDYFNTTKISYLITYPVMPRFRSTITLTQSPSDRYFISDSAWFIDLQLYHYQHLGKIGGNYGNNHTYIYTHTSLDYHPEDILTVTLIDKSVLETLQGLLSCGKYNINGFTPTENDDVAVELSQLLNNTISSNFIVKYTFTYSMGKFGVGQTAGYVYLDIKYALQQMILNSYYPKGIYVKDSPLLRFVQSGEFRLEEFSMYATINVPDRIKRFSSSDYAATYTYMTGFATKINNQLSLFALKSEMPIASILPAMSYFGMFIGVLLKLVIVALFILSVIMMNNMLLMSVERKHFDFGLLKIMGAGRVFVIANLLTGSLKYVFYGNIIAYPLAYLSLQIVSNIFYSFFGYHYSIYPSADSILGGLIIGVLVPLVSAIVPIWDILKNDLASSMNPTRNKTEAIRTEIYIEGRYFPTTKLVFGLLATLYGLMVYYLLPKGMINQDISLLLIVFFTILEGLLLGLIILSYSVQYLFEKAVAYVLLFWTNKTDFMLTFKNLYAHRVKNRRSSILYALSVSFIVFVSVGIQIQIQTIYNYLLKNHGCYVYINGMIDPYYYNPLLASTPGVVDWAYRTVKLQYYLERFYIKYVLISDKAKLFFAKNSIIGISPNYLNTFYFYQLSVVKTISEPPYDPYSYLYTPYGEMTCTIGSYMAKKLNIFEGTNRYFYINYYTYRYVRRITMNQTSIFDKRIGLYYSPIAAIGDIGVSLDTFKRIAGVGSSAQIPYSSVKIKITSPDQAASIGNYLRNQISNSTFDNVWDYSELKSTIDRIQNLLDNILIILLVVVLIISFFSLVTTSYLNIINQTNYIGILLILGYYKQRVARIYIYEAFVLVVNSCLIGIFVGYFVAWMMGLQRYLFMDLPVLIHINGLPIIIAAAIVSSLLSSYKPLKYIFSQSISQIMNYAS